MNTPAMRKNTSRDRWGFEHLSERSAMPKFLGLWVCYCLLISLSSPISGSILLRSAHAIKGVWAVLASPRSLRTF